MALGIPQKVLDKIFKPFFTIKQQNREQDCIYRWAMILLNHMAAEIKVEMKESERAAFVIQLPNCLN